jgi:hypothetical protein
MAACDDFNAKGIRDRTPIVRALPLLMHLMPCHGALSAAPAL